MGKVEKKGERRGGGGRGGRSSMPNTTLSFLFPRASYETNTRREEMKEDEGRDRERWREERSECMMER
jgi:hypothetical protein